ncbi:MAG: hypothetical protein ABFC57_12835 [Veillonellales bacterium]
MDVKTAVKILRKSDSYVCGIEIADFIQQQKDTANRYPEFAEVIEELEKAIKNHVPMNSAHEGYAVIKEELDELWDEVKKRNPDPELLRMEARQVAAMGIRFMIDILRPEKADERG